MAGWQGRPWAWTLLLCVAGCARGGSADPLQPYTDSGSASHATDAGEDSGSNVVPYDAGGDGDQSGDGDHSIPQQDAGMSQDAGGNSSEDAGNTQICTLQNTCEQARTIGSGSIDGDQGNDLVQTTGTRSEWLAVDVKEAVSSLSGVNVTFTVSLSIEGDANYDLFVYYGDNKAGANTAVSCDTPKQSSANPGSASESTMTTISDVLTADDSRRLRIEVRHISGDCGAWTLTVAGHT